MNISPPRLSDGSDNDNKLEEEDSTNDQEVGDSVGETVPILVLKPKKGKNQICPSQDENEKILSIKSKVKEPLEAHCFVGNELETTEITLKWLKKLKL